MRIIINLFLFFLFLAHHAQAIELLGITWTGGLSHTLELESYLVSIDPYTGTVIEKYLQLPTSENFVGSTYDSNHDILYAVSQSTNNLYTINPNTLEFSSVGTLSFDIEKWSHIQAPKITYDNLSDTLYATVRVDNWPTFNGSILAKVDTKNAQLDSIAPINGSINNVIISGLGFDEQNGHLVAIASKYGADPGSEYHNIVTISPTDASMNAVFDLPNDAFLLSFVKKPGENIYYSWANTDTGHYYTEINTDEESFTFLGSTDPWVSGDNATGLVCLAEFYENGLENGYTVTSDLWIRAVINTVEKGPVEAVWKKGGEDTTSRGDRVIWGHFYTNPSDVAWGSENNPDLFVKIWFDISGRVDVNYFHVSVPDIEVYSDYPFDGTQDEYGTTTVSRRYIRQYYEDGQSYSDENYEDGNPPSGYSTSGNPSGYSTINDLRIGSMINTVEKGLIDGIWRLGGQDTTFRGDQVVWGHFYASPSDVAWGNQENPDLFVKIWFDVSGRVDVNFFHVSVPDIEVYSDLPSDSTYNQKGTTIMDNRYIRHEYWR